MKENVTLAHQTYAYKVADIAHLSDSMNILAWVHGKLWVGLPHRRHLYFLPLTPMQVWHSAPSRDSKSTLHFSFAELITLPMTSPLSVFPVGAEVLQSWDSPSPSPSNPCMQDERQSSKWRPLTLVSPPSFLFQLWTTQPYTEVLSSSTQPQLVLRLLLQGHLDGGFGGHGYQEYGLENGGWAKASFLDYAAQDRGSCCQGLRRMLPTFKKHFWMDD